MAIENAQDDGAHLPERRAAAEGVSSAVGAQILRIRRVSQVNEERVGPIAQLEVAQGSSYAPSTF
jgi:hypothetical protein